MYPTQSSNGPGIDVGYVPYFYQAGLHHMYPLQPASDPQQGRASPQSPHEASSDVSFSRHPDRTQTVEQIIANGYFSVPKGDSVMAPISDRQQTSWLGLDDAINQIRRRYEIHEENLYRIDLGKCAAMNAIYLHEAYQGPPNSKQTYAKHKAIQGLYEEERAELTTLWKDVSRLKMQIPESAQLYLSASRKASILAPEPGDAP